MDRAKPTEQQPVQDGRDQADAKREAGADDGACPLREQLAKANLLVTKRRDPPVRFQNSAIAADLRFQAAGSYSLIRPPRIGRRLIRSYPRSGRAC